MLSQAKGIKRLFLLLYLFPDEHFGNVNGGRIHTNLRVSENVEALHSHFEGNCKRQVAFNFLVSELEIFQLLSSGTRKTFSRKGYGFKTSVRQRRERDQPRS